VRSVRGQVGCRHWEPPLETGGGAKEYQCPEREIGGYESSAMISKAAMQPDYSESQGHNNKKILKSEERKGKRGKGTNGVSFFNKNVHRRAANDMGDRTKK